MASKSNPQIDIKEWGSWRIAWVSKSNFTYCCNLLCEGQIDGLGVSPHHGSDFDDLHDFAGIESLRSLVLPFCRSLNLEHLGLMTQLRHLVVGEANGIIDLANLSCLEDATLDWSSDLVLPRSAAKMRCLRIDKFKPASSGVLAINRFHNLTSLELVQSNIETLEGIKEFKQLEVVQLHYMKMLTSIRHIVETPVKQFTLTHCKKVADLHVVSECAMLEVLRYHYSAPLSTIAFVNQCPKLREFRFVGVDVKDGDMTPLARLQDFAFTQKKHFSHTEKALRMRHQPDV